MDKVFRLTAGGEHFSHFRPELRHLLEQSGLNDKQTADVLLAVQEVLTNIFRHGYQGKPGQINVSFRNEPDLILLTVQDFGEKFDLTRVPNPKLPPVDPGGLGIYFVKTVMDKVEYDDTSEEGNLLRLIKLKTMKNSKEV